MLSLLAAAALAVGQAAPAAPAAPGASGFPALSGATPAPDCAGLRDVIADGDPAMQCVTAPLERIGDLARTLAGQARENGWTVTGANTNVLWMQKPAAEGLCDKLTIIGFWNYREHPEPIAGIPGYVGVMITPGQTCQTQPPAPNAQ